MIKQDWMIIIAGEPLVDRMSEETKRRCEYRGGGYASDQLCALQCEQAGRGILGVELVKSIYGWSVRYDSGLQNFGLVARTKARGGELDGSLEAATAFATKWVASDPERRYAWMRKDNVLA
jgi:hypothetical protein